MAKIQLDTVSSATTAFIALNNYTVQLESGKACTLHLAYSKHHIRPVDPALESQKAQVAGLQM